jgi:hypothetical protein
VRRLPTDIELVVEQSPSLITLSKTGILAISTGTCACYTLSHFHNRETSLSHDTLASITRPRGPELLHHSAILRHSATQSRTATLLGHEDQSCCATRPFCTTWPHSPELLLSLAMRTRAAVPLSHAVPNCYTTRP